MSIKDIPFSFFGTSESKLPIVAGLQFGAISTNNFVVEFKIFDEGTEGPVTDYGIIYSETDEDPVIGAPGVSQQSLGGNPPSIPATINGTITGLTDTTEYYVRAYAINSEGAAYTPVRELETNWDALTIQFYISTQSTSYRLLKIGDYYNSSTSRVKVRFPDGSVQYPSQSNIITIDTTAITDGNYMLAIAAADSNSTFENFTLEQMDSAYANPKLFHWGTNKWKSLAKAFLSTNMISYADDHPDLSECISLNLCFFGRSTYFNNGSQAVFPSGPIEDINQWDVSNVEEARAMFAGCTDLGRFGLCDFSSWNWANCRDFEAMFQNCSNTGDLAGSAVPAGGLDLSGWQFSQDPNLVVVFDSMFQNMYRWEPGQFAGKGDLFDLTTAGFTKFRMDLMFENMQRLCTRIPSAGLNIEKILQKFSQCTAADTVGTPPRMIGTFKGCGNINDGLTIDFTALDLGRFHNLNRCFSNTKFTPLSNNWSTMFTNEDWTTYAPTSTRPNKDWTDMFQGCDWVPPLDNWVFDGVFSMNQMFAYAKYGYKPSYAAYNSYVLDLSTWKTSIDNNVPDTTNPNQTLSVFGMFRYNRESPPTGTPTSDYRGAPLGIETWTWNGANSYINFRSIFEFNNGLDRDLSGWDMSGATDIAFMFYQCDIFNNAGQALNWTFPTALVPGGNVIEARFMFYGAQAFNADISGWNVNMIGRMDQFIGNPNAACAGAFDQDLSNWELENMSNMTQFQLTNSGTWSTANFDATLIGWAKNIITLGNTPTNVAFGVDTNCSTRPSCLPAASGGPYNTAADIVSVQDAIDYLTSVKNWTITTGPCV